MLPAVLSCKAVRFAYPDTDFMIHIDDFELHAGESVFLQGASGTGKSTFLNLVGGVLEPSEGAIRLMGKHLGHLSAGACDALRVAHIGFLFQQFNLLGYLNVMDNVLLPCRFSAIRRSKALAVHSTLEKAAGDLLSQLGMSDCINRPVRQLSVGQQQRVAAARALIGCPDLIVADEPTSALDEGHQSRFLNVLMQQARQSGTALVFVSHDLRLSHYFDRTQHMADWRAGI